MTALLPESERLIVDIHARYCNRSGPAMRSGDPRVTAHQVEGLVADRLAAIEAAARATERERFSVERLARAIHAECEEVVAEKEARRPGGQYTLHDATAHLPRAAAILAALAAEP